MSQHNSPIPDVPQPVRRAAAHPWVEKLARFGYAAKGVVYFVVGLLAAQAAFGVGGQITDTEGALQTIVTQPFGKFLLALVTVGLVGYVVWRMVQTVLDPEHSDEQTNAKQVARRIGSALSGFAYAGLAITAVKLILGNGGGNGDATQDWTARFMAQPFGQWLVGLGGIATIAVGLAYLYQAYKAKFQKHFKLSEMSQRERTWAKRMGQFGIAARGVVFAVIGFFLVQAALQSNASEARGLSGALASLSRQPFGSWILGLVALGLIAYSIYSLIEARYRKIGH
ncbi:MAG: DUF1206 domain-containing protein [Cyanobacteria bacterium RM1_2_2]|nr:DUF1206 domain-containing protein [Cyanobacteria bacterium RM1_2_2]